MPDNADQTPDLTYTLTGSYTASWAFSLAAKLPPLTGSHSYIFYDAYNISKVVAGVQHNAIVIYMKRTDVDTAVTWSSANPHVGVTVPTVKNFTGAASLSNSATRTLFILFHEVPASMSDIASLHDNVEEIYTQIALLGRPYNTVWAYTKKKNSEAIEGIDIPRKAGMTLINRT